MDETKKGIVINGLDIGGSLVNKAEALAVLEGTSLFEMVTDLLSERITVATTAIEAGVGGLNRDFSGVWLKEVGEGRKIAAIKAIRQHCGLALKEAKQITDNIGVGGHHLFRQNDILPHTTAALFYSDLKAAGATAKPEYDFNR